VGRTTAAARRWRTATVVAVRVAASAIAAYGSRWASASNGSGADRLALRLGVKLARLTDRPG
jgi:hypothetical protein